MDLLVPALAATLGFVLGIAVGAARAFRLAAQRRAVAGAAAGIGRMAVDALPTRSAADILSGRIRIILGGLPYDLPVLPRRASREWLEALDARFAHIASELDEAADDKPRILSMLAGQQSDLLAMLRAYDQTNVLPDAQYVDDFVTDAEILVAMVEVWRAANPLAATLVEAADEPTGGISSEQQNTSEPTTAGLPTMSTGT